MKTLYIRPTYNSLQPMKNIFLLTALMSSFLSIYFSFYFTIELIFSFIVSIITIILIIIYKIKFDNNQNKWLYGEV